MRLLGLSAGFSVCILYRIRLFGFFFFFFFSLFKVGEGERLFGLILIKNDGLLAQDKPNKNPAGSEKLITAQENTPYKKGEEGSIFFFFSYSMSVGEKGN
jgi:hypothetical protein